MKQNKIKTIDLQMVAIKDKLLKEAKKRRIILRLFGGLAFIEHCPKYNHLFGTFNRNFLDIDFVGCLKQVVKIQKLFLDLGFQENKNVMRLFGTQRRIFELSDFHIDVVLDRLHFCHDVDLRERLEIDYPTVSLSDLLLSKLQIVRISKKDFLDTIILLREHNVGDTDKETINVKYISRLCSNNWGLWKTVISNLEKLKKVTEAYLVNHQEDARNVSSKINILKKQIEEGKKSFKWNLRALIGERIKWYREVEELQ